MPAGIQDSLRQRGVRVTRQRLLLLQHIRPQRPPSERRKPVAGAWTEDFEMKARPDWDKTGLFEYVCGENDRCPGGKCKEK